MKRFFFFILSVALTLPAYSQTPMKEKSIDTTIKTIEKKYDSLVDVVSAYQNKLESSLDTLKCDTKIIKTNTEPPSVIVEFVKNKFLDKVYNTLFGNEEKRGIVPIVLSLIGFLVGLLRIGWLIFKFKKIKGSDSQKVQNIFICILLLVISVLMFILSNKKYTSPETVELSKLYDKIDAIQKDIQVNKVATIKDTVSNTSVPEISSKLNNITREMNKMEQAIYKSEQKTAEKINDKSANGFWIFLDTLLLTVIAGILIIKLWQEYNG